MPHEHNHKLAAFLLSSGTVVFEHRAGAAICCGMPRMPVGDDINAEAVLLSAIYKPALPPTQRAQTSSQTCSHSYHICHSKSSKLGSTCNIPIINSPSATFSHYVTQQDLAAAAIASGTKVRRRLSTHSYINLPSLPPDSPNFCPILFTQTSDLILQVFPAWFNLQHPNPRLSINQVQ